MSGAAPPPAIPRARTFSALQFILFLGAGLVGLAALLAAGLAFGLALAGAAILAVLVVAGWFVAANLIDGERPTRALPPGR